MLYVQSGAVTMKYFKLFNINVCKGLNVSYILLKPCNTVSACRALDTKLYLCVHLHNTGFLIYLGGIFAWEKDILLA